MNRDQVIGEVILLGSLIGLSVYGWLLYAYAIVVLQITAFIAVAGLLIILAWMRWTMTTRSPPPMLKLCPDQWLTVSLA